MTSINYGNYEEMVSRQPIKTAGDYIKAFVRHRAQFVVISISVFFVSALVAFLIPSEYKSTSTILIEQQEIPQDLVRTTITSFADQRIQTISQRVMTRANLMQIINEFNLYEDERKTETLETVLKEMTENINLSMISADVVDPRSGRPTKATIAFTLSFTSDSAELAQKVADKLTTLYLNENLKTRTTMTEEAESFLTSEAERLSKEITTLEKELASFKERHIGSLPELSQLNMNLIERTENELFQIDREIQAVNERKIYLESELVQQSPKIAIFSETGERILSPMDRLKTLEAKYISLSSIYSSSHPDVERMRKEIEALKATIASYAGGQNGYSTKGGNIKSLNDLENQLAKARLDYEQLLLRYSEAHPDVQRAKLQIANLENIINKESGNPTQLIQASFDSEPDNPAYIELQAKLNAALSDLEALKNNKSKLKGKLAQYEARVTESPEVERKFRSLSRDYDNAWNKYQEIKTKQMEAKLAKSLESERKGERFTLIDPAQFPEEPTSPNRKALLFFALILGLGCAVVTVVVMDNLDKTIRGNAGVIALLHAAPLAGIPYIITEAEKTNESSRRLILAAVTVSLMVVSIVLVHFLIIPLDIVWYVLLRKIGINLG